MFKHKIYFRSQYNMNAIVLTQIQLTMYSKTGHHTESWDTPTSHGYCHCVSLPAWNVWNAAGHTPL